MERTVNFAGRTAVVTGGASGIGKGIATRLGERGANVVIADIDQNALDSAAEELDVLGVHTDVTDADSVQALAERVINEYGSVHTVCNNAGIGPMAPTTDLTLDDWRWMIDVNLWGVIHGIHSFLPILQRNDDWGHIVNTSSMSVLAPPMKLAPYVAAKAGVFGLTEVLSKELADAGSQVGATVLAPAFVRTNINNSLRTRPAEANISMTDAHFDGLDDSAWISPEDVGDIVLNAITGNRLYAVTHADWLDRVAERHDSIQEGFAILAHS